MIVWKRKGVYKANAQRVSEELESITNRSPEEIVKYAEDENTELHKCFTWDDTEAARNWRLHEARQIVCNIVYEKDDEPDEEPVRLRVFYQDKTEENSTYTPIKVIVRDEEKYESLLRQAQSELRAFKKKYSMLKELSEIFDLID